MYTTEQSVGTGGTAAPAADSSTTPTAPALASLDVKALRHIAGSLPPDTRDCRGEVVTKADAIQALMWLEATARREPDRTLNVQSLQWMRRVAVLLELAQESPVAATSAETASTETASTETITESATSEPATESTTSGHRAPPSAPALPATLEEPEVRNLRTSGLWDSTIVENGFETWRGKRIDGALGWEFCAAKKIDPNDPTRLVSGSEVDNAGLAIACVPLAKGSERHGLREDQIVDVTAEPWVAKPGVLPEYPDVEPDMHRIKPRNPRASWDSDSREYKRAKTGELKSVKYESPRDKPPPIFVPAEVRRYTGEVLPFYSPGRENPYTPGIVADALRAAWLVLIEGEKKAALLAQCGLFAISIPGIYNAHDSTHAKEAEAKGLPKNEWYKLRREIVELGIADRVVYIFFDHSDKPNPHEPMAAQRIADMAYAKGAKAVYYCTPPADSGTKGADDRYVQAALGGREHDLSLDCALTLDHAAGKAAIEACLANAKLLPNTRHGAKSTTSNGRAAHGGDVKGSSTQSTGNGPSVPGVESSEDKWPDPIELPTMPPVPAWDDQLLPESLRPWLTDIIERTQCPPEYVAVGAIVSLGSVIGRQCAIRPKRQDEWTVVVNLWGATVGAASTMKTPALDASTRPLRKLAADASEAYRDRATTREELDAQLNAARKALRNAAGAGEDTSEIRTKYETILAEAAAANVERRYVVHDTTTEKLGEILNMSPNGVLLFRDELVGWLASLERQGHECDRALFLEMWNGTGEFVYDRIGRGTIRIKAACVSILGGIQPGPLSGYLRDALSGGSGADGLMQRFQLLVYPDPSRDWKSVDRWPDTDARQRVVKLFQRLSKLGLEDSGARRDEDDDGTGLAYLRFDVEAQAVFDRWHGDLMRRVRTSDDHEAIVGHLMKYASLMPSLALIFELANGGADFVRPAAVDLAIRWCDVLEAHARRVYAVVTAGELTAARALLAKIRAGKLPEPFGARDVYRAQWSGLTDTEVVERALEVLEAHGWVRLTLLKTGGRPRLQAWIHPSLRPAPQGAPAP